MYYSTPLPRRNPSKIFSWFFLAKSLCFTPKCLLPNVSCRKKCHDFYQILIELEKRKSFFSTKGLSFWGGHKKSPETSGRERASPEFSLYLCCPPLFFPRHPGQSTPSILGISQRLPPLFSGSAVTFVAVWKGTQKKADTTNSLYFFLVKMNLCFIHFSHWSKYFFFRLLSVS